MSQTIEAMLSEEQVIECCKYLQHSIEARRENPDYDIAPDLQEIADITQRNFSISAQASIEIQLPHLVRINWREIDEFELAAVLRDAGVLTLDEIEWVCPFRGDTFVESLKLMREETARRNANDTNHTTTNDTRRSGFAEKYDL